MYNAKIVSHSVQDAAIESGEGCLSVDREVPIWLSVTRV